MKLAYRLLLTFAILLCLPACLPLPPVPPLPRQAGRTRVKYAPLPPVTNAESPIAFKDVAVRAGLHYRWTIAGKRPLTILQTMGYGCAFCDYNGDGYLDILLIGTTIALYRGDGKSHFIDVTHAMGLDKLHGCFMGCAIGDFDNDGYDDIYLSGYHTGVLLHNEHGRYFRDVTAKMGLQPQPWGTSCTFVDLDGDGFLDLFVGNYVRFDTSSRQICPQKGILTACTPSNYPALRGVLYHNLAGKRFEDATAKWTAWTTGNDLGVACASLDRSGKIALAFANDEVEGDLLHVQKAGHLINTSAGSGVGTDRFGHRHAGMGIDWGDYDNDGKPDLFVTTFAHEDKCLYHNLGEGLFEERGVETGVASALEPYVSFGCKFADFDNDGWLDLLVANGHVNDNVTRISPKEQYRQPLELLRNTGQPPVAFDRATASAGLHRLAPIVGRGLAVGDFDNDGRIDALVVDREGMPVLLHNETHPAGHWLGFHLIGTHHSPRDAYGAVVTVAFGKDQRVRQCHVDGSYLSASDMRVHFGLGQATHVDRVTIRWPDGRVETRTGLPVDRYITWTEA